MAKRRMFSLDVVDSDKFLDMPASTQNLYFHLGMRADDDGFVSSPKKITTSVNCSADDFKLLLAKGYIIPFDSGICVIKDWRINNCIKSDRYVPTLHTDEMQQLTLGANKSYELTGTPCFQNGSKMVPQYSIDEYRKDSFAAKPQRGRKQCIPPTLEEVKRYITEKNLSVNPTEFIDYYTVGDWCDSNGQKVKNWKQKLLSWNKRKLGNVETTAPVEPTEVKDFIHF